MAHKFFVSDLFAFIYTQASFGAHHEALIKDALSAAPPTLVDSVSVVDWDGNVLRKGTGDYTCMPTPPRVSGNQPMCLDGPWTKWADAWNNKKPLDIARLGISYMLVGDEGASNIDPYATGPTDDNQWIVEGPHLMIIVPDSKLLEGIPADPSQGGPYVMWQGSPYQHIMVPVGPR